MELNIVATILYITLYCSSNEFIKLRIRKVNPKLIKLLKIVDGEGGLQFQCSTTICSTAMIQTYVSRLM